MVHHRRLISNLTTHRIKASRPDGLEELVDRWRHLVSISIFYGRVRLPESDLWSGTIIFVIAINDIDSSVINSFKFADYTEMY